MPQALIFVAPGVFGAAGSLALVTASGALTLAGSLASIGGSLLLSAAASALNKQSPTKPDNVQVNSKLGTAARVGHVGIVKVGGNFVYHRAFNGVSYRVCVHGHGAIDETLETYLNNIAVPVDAQGRVTDPQYLVAGGNLEAGLGDGTGGAANDSRVRIFERSGAVPSPYYDQVEAVDFGWTEFHRLDEMWTSLIVCESVPSDEFRDVYPNGEPHLQKKARTARCFDPRDASTAFTENAALVINYYLALPDGLNRPGALDENDLIAAANVADQVVALAGGGTEPKYRISGSWLFTERPQDVLTRMLAACAGRMRLKPTGKIGLKLGAWVPPEFAITYDMILELRDVSPGPDLLDRFNSVPARYVDHRLEHVEIDAQIWRDTARIAIDGEELPGQALDLLMSPSHRQTRQVMKIETARRNPELSLDLVLKPKAFPAIYEDVVTLTLPEFGITGAAEIESFDLVMKDGNLQAVSLKLRLIDPDAYTQTLDEQGQQQNMPPAQATGGLPVPASFVAAGAGIQVAQNAYTAGIACGWAAPPSDALTPRLRHAPTGTTNWTEVQLAAGVVSAQIGSLVDGDDYDLELAWVAPSGQVGPAATATVTATAANLAPDPPTALAVTDQTGGNALVELVASVSPELWKTVIYRDTVEVATSFARPGEAISFTDASGAGTFDWTAESINVSGLQSATQAGPVTATIT